MGNNRVLGKTVIVDIDGTVANCEHRVPYIKQGKEGYEKFKNECDKDKPIPDIINLVGLLNITCMIVFCTAREDAQREKTEAWIKKYMPKISHYSLLMKKDGDTRTDDIVKPGLLKTVGLTPKDVYIILDDRTRVVKAWRKAGYTCLQVANGDF